MPTRLAETDVGTSAAHLSRKWPFGDLGRMDSKRSAISTLAAAAALTLVAAVPAAHYADAQPD